MLLTDKKRKVLSPYFTEISGYIEKGYTSAKIDGIIRSKGYKGSISTVIHYISNWKSRLKRFIWEIRMKKVLNL